MSTKESVFTVTLPSNTDMKTYPKNRGSDFQVKLANPLSLEGECLNDDNSWEVAITSLQYTNQFFDVPKTMTIRVLIEYREPPGPMTANVPRPFNTFQFENKVTRTQMAPFLDRRLAPFNTGLLDKIDAAVVLRHAKEDTKIPDGPHIVLGKIFILAAQYGSGLAVHNMFVAKFNELFGGPRYNVKIVSRMVNANGTMKLILDPPTPVNVYIYADTPMAASVLGLKQGERIPVSREDETQDLWMTKYNDCDLPPRIEAIQSLYVYCDIVKHQHVGDVVAPLLEVVPVKGKLGERVHYSVSVPSYLPLSRSFIDLLYVYIRDEKGNEVSFPDEMENVVVRLRFRRKKVRGTDTLW